MAAQAAPAFTSPLSGDFIFHNVGTHAPCRSLIRVLRDPTPQAQHPVAFDIGDLLNDAAVYRIRTQLHGGRLGIPGVMITLETRANGNDTHGASVSVIFEPGVAARGFPGKYNLDWFQAGFLGQVGGGGAHYINDPQVVGQAPLADRRRVLRLEMETYGPYTLSAVAPVVQNTAPNSDIRRLIQALTSPGKLRLRVYLIVVGIQPQIYTDSIVEPLCLALHHRAPPYHQYTTPDSVLSVSLEGLQTFRRRMYCPRTRAPGGNYQFGPATMLLPDTRGRDHPRPLAVVGSVGLIREKQAYDRFPNDLGSRPQSIRIVQTSSALHQTNSRTLYGVFPRPAEERLLLGYVKVVKKSSQVPISAPQSGTIFYFHLRRVTNGDQTELTQFKGYGIVLDVPRDCIDGHSHFVLALLPSTAGVHQLSTPSLNANIQSIASHPVSLNLVRNDKHTKAQLAALRQFWSTAVAASSIALRELHDKILDRSHITAPPPVTRDLTSGPHADNAVQLRYTDYVTRMLNAPGMAHSTALERQCLQALPQNVSTIQTIISHVDRPSFRAFALLLLALADAGHKVVIACNDVPDRSTVCNLLQTYVRNTINHLINRADDFRNRRIVCYTTTEVEIDEPTAGNVSLSNIANPARPGLELAFKYLVDDFPSTRYMLQQEPIYQQSLDDYPPADEVPVIRSMGYAVQQYLNRPATSAQRRGNYLTARQRALNAQITDHDAAVQDLRARTQAVNAVLRDTEILITDYKTATTESVRKHFVEPIIVCLGTEKVRFDTAGALLAAYERWTCAFVVGDPADNRRQVSVGASHSNNEAWETFRKSFWNLVHTNGGNDFDLR